MPDILSLDDIAAIATQTAHADPAAAYRAIDALAQRLFGHRLFTVTRSLHETKEVERVYSSNLTAYPIGGRKQKQDTDWGTTVLDKGEVMICHNEADIRRTFSDHELILSLGITCLINVPVLFAGRSVATMNISHATDRFGPADIPALKLLAACLLPLILSGKTG
jgi:GAF domain-containing protein